MTKTPRARDFEAKPAPAGTGKVGVLLINLGTPDATTYWPMRRYLKEFLSDRRVIETNRALWWAILNGVVLVKRPVSSGAKYRSIWNEALDESPLRTITRAQAEKMAAAFAGRPGIVVDWAMRYGNPSIPERIDALVAQGCDRILSVPLYPQYAAATTATANDKVFEALMKLRAQPALRTVPPYPADPVYIDALANSIRTHLAGLDFAPEAILASFHGVPQNYIDKGDPYQAQCVQTTEALRAALGPELGAKLKLTFQSRFGRAEWIKPYTDKTVEALARDGVKSIAIVTPGFAADCVETLEEIADENREIFLEHGGMRFAYIPCLNDSAGGIAVLVQPHRAGASGLAVTRVAGILGIFLLVLAPHAQATDQARALRLCDGRGRAGRRRGSTRRFAQPEARCHRARAGNRLPGQCLRGAGHGARRAGRQGQGKRHHRLGGARSGRPAARCGAPDAGRPQRFARQEIGARRPTRRRKRPLQTSRRCCRIRHLRRSQQRPLHSGPAALFISRRKHG